jgi:HK97 family phage portal protein
VQYGGWWNDKHDGFIVAHAWPLWFLWQRKGGFNMMKFRERFLTAASILLRGKGAFEQAFLRGLPLSRETVTDPYREHAWVYACITTIMRKVAGVPFVIASRAKDSEGNQVELVEHPAARLFRTVNPEMSRSELWQATVLYLYLRGEALWLLEFDPASRDVVEIWPADPKTATPLFNEERQLIGWRLSDGRGRQIPFSRDEVVRFRFLHSGDSVRGLAPIEPARLPIGQDFKAAKHNEALLNNSAVPGGVISVPEVMSDAEFKRMKRQWEEGHQGISKRGKMGWLTGGMKFEPLGLSQKDLDFIAGRRFNREEILAVFGVPPAEVGVHEFSNYANAREQARKFWHNTLIPLLVHIEEALESKFFLKHFPDVVGHFDLANVEDLQDNLEVKSQVATRLFAMGVPFSDINKRLQMGFNTENRPWLQVGWLSSPSQAPALDLLDRIRAHYDALRDKYDNQAKEELAQWRRWKEENKVSSDERRIAFRAFCDARLGALSNDLRELLFLNDVPQEGFERVREALIGSIERGEPAVEAVARAAKAIRKLPQRSICAKRADVRTVLRSSGESVSLKLSPEGETS